MLTHPVKFLHPTVELGIAWGAIDAVRGQFMCMTAPFSAGFVAVNASTLPSSSQVWLWSQKGVVISNS